MNTNLSLHYPGTEDEVRKQRSESNTADIREEIEPVATTVCRTIFLQSSIAPLIKTGHKTAPIQACHNTSSYLQWLRRNSIHSIPDKPAYIQR